MTAARRVTATYVRQLGHRLRESRSKRPILVFQMGKVGSRTITTSLDAARLKDPVYHEHFLSEHHMAIFQRKIDQGTKVERPSQVLARIGAMRAKIFSDDGKRWKVITLVREPIARGVGTFMSGYFKDKNISIPEIGLGPNEMKSLHEKYAERGHKYDEYASTWFQAELKGVFGFDVFSTDFPKDKGYKIYEGDRADLLLIRLEDLNTCHKDAFREFLDIADLKLVSANMAKDKAYYPAYREFAKTMRFPHSFLEETYSFDVVRHFYTQDEIDGFKARWSRLSEPAATTLPT